MLRKLFFAIVTLVALPALARRRAVIAPAPLTRAEIVSTAIRVADRVTIDPVEPRRHWENAPYLDGLVLFGDELQHESNPAGARLIERAASVILGSDDDITNLYWGDGTAYAQVALDLYRVLPAGDPRREALLATLAGPMSFAGHAIRVSPTDGTPRDPWWIDGGFGTRYWQDDMYMVIPWLAMNGSSRDGLPANELSRNLAYEWIDAYVYDHRPASSDPREVAVPSAAARNGFLLWDPEHDLFQHQPEWIGRSDFFWGRGNGWSAVALMRAAHYLDAPYSGTRYPAVLGAPEIRDLLVRIAASVKARQTPDGGWGSDLSHPLDCPTAETSATAMMTLFLARGINEGWLDRDAYLPVVQRAFALLMQRVDARGVIAGIQPPGIGPDCSRTIASDDVINVNYGAGVWLLAASEVLKDF
jgi:glycosyl hydrolase family 88